MKSHICIAVAMALAVLTGTSSAAADSVGNDSIEVYEMDGKYGIYSTVCIQPSGGAMRPIWMPVSVS